MWAGLGWSILAALEILETRKEAMFGSCFPFSGSLLVSLSPTNQTMDILRETLGGH